MKIFDDMTFEGSPQALKRLIEQIDRSSKIGPWRRDSESEQSYALIRPAPQTERCFRTRDEAELPDALLWLIASESHPRSWRVTNIVPAESNASFTAGTYFSLLISFRDATLPMASALGVSISMPRLDVGPEYWLTPKSAQLLHFFSEMANRSTGASHPLDRKRWHAFVKSVHEEGSEVGSDDVLRILVEHEHWPENKATELAAMFADERALLSDFAKSA